MQPTPPGSATGPERALDPFAESGLSPSPTHARVRVKTPPPRAVDAPPEDAPVTRWLRAQGIALLDEAQAAVTRLEDPADGEALHDLRVALRRLRSSLRAWRGHLPRAASRGVRRRLRRFAEGTGAARDLEVQLAFLDAERARLRDDSAATEGATGTALAESEAALAWLASRLQARRAAAAEKVHEEAPLRLLAIDARLRRRLFEDAAAPRADEPAVRAALAPLIEAHCTALLDSARDIASALDENGAHAARIAAKRFRYLVEPLRGARDPALADGARALVKQLKGLQDTLGDLHDAHVLFRLVRRSRGAVASRSEARDGEGEALLRGLGLVEADLAARRDLLHARVEEQRDGGGLAALSDGARALAARLAAG